ncbi:MAG: hypothetical protein R6T99_10355 [Bacteroidales bacterium]
MPQRSQFGMPGKMMTALFVFLSMGTLISHAQNRNEEVTIIAPYDPTITDAFKINMNPRTQGQIIEMPVLEYSITPVRLNTRITPDRPESRLKPYEPGKDLKSNHVRAGFGNYTTPYFEFFANSLQSQEFNLGVNLKHRSSSGKIKDFANSAYSHNLAHAYGEKYFDNHTLGGEIRYKRDVYHYYGYKPDAFPDIDLSKNDIQHRYQYIGGKLNLQSTHTGEDAFNHAIGLNYYYLSDNYNTREQNLHFNAGIDKRFEWFDVTEYQNFGLDLEIDYYFNEDSLHSYNAGIIRLKPMLSTDFYQYRFFVGADLAYSGDSTSELHIHPLARIEIHMIRDVLTAYAGIRGEIRRSSLLLLSRENPFIQPTVTADYTNNKFAFSAGLLGNIEDVVDYTIEASNTKIDHMPFFVNDTANGLLNTFGVLYDNVNRFSITGNVNVNSGNVFRLNIKAGYDNYSMDNEEKAWHKPNFSAGIGAWYTLAETFTMGMEIITEGPVYAKLYNEQQEVIAEQIDARADLNLSFEYRISEDFSAFLNFNNILNNDYLKWYNYPVQKFNFLGGIGFSF